ncbi:Squalene monooxygenase [Musa troglodytarum]|uniref:Squalene monooxygenase n=1 Tax=Musa troglodytarum TaxID=320322 RepID=A0A9E7H5S9_9LILI|nr:Squalene monooxygenase [Musa troglodytarum]URE23764.1 Squalene monooxygenase [Musa troglodytarum]
MACNLRRTISLWLVIFVVRDEGGRREARHREWWEKKMEETYPLGVITASILAFLFLVGIHGRWGKGRKAAGKRGSGAVAAGLGGADVIVVGAGVTGSALAYALGKDGRRVHVIERDLAEPDRIVGEILQPGGCLNLFELGLEDCVDEIDAQRVLGYVLYKNGRRAKLSICLEKYHVDVAARGFHHGRFIQRLREKAASLSSVQLKQGTVTSLIKEDGIVKGVVYKTKSGEESKAFAPLTIVCDGCFSNLRHTLCSSEVDVLSYFVGLLLENCQLPFPNHGHIILADPSVVLFYSISSTETRCLVDVPVQKVPSIANGEMENYLKTIVAPQVPTELHDAFVAAIDKGNIRTMPCKSMPADAHLTPGVLLMGDAFNMRHPITGGGMTVGLSDVIVLRNLLRPLHDLHDAAALCKYLESFYILRKPVASTMNMLADAFYKLFGASPDEARKEIGQAYFDCLSLGGGFSSDSTALIGGLNASPLHLVIHFLVAVTYGVGHLLLPIPSVRGLHRSARLIYAAAGIVLPLMKAEGVRQTFFPATFPAYYRAPPAQLKQ